VLRDAEALLERAPLEHCGVRALCRMTLEPGSSLRAY